jgi:hypothetical protein
MENTFRAFQYRWVLQPDVALPVVLPTKPKTRIDIPEVGPTGAIIITEGDGEWPACVGPIGITPVQGLITTHAAAIEDQGQAPTGQPQGLNRTVVVGQRGGLRFTPGPAIRVSNSPVNAIGQTAAKKLK